MGFRGPHRIQDGLDGFMRVAEDRQIDQVYCFLRDKGYMDRLPDKVRLAVSRKHARRLFMMGSGVAELESLWRDCEQAAGNPRNLFFWSLREILA